MNAGNALVPVLTPHGHLLLAPEQDAPALAPELAGRLQESFARGVGYGLLGLGAAEMTARSIKPETKFQPA